MKSECEGMNGPQSREKDQLDVGYNCLGKSQDTLMCDDGHGTHQSISR